jgi:hypothetical protein
MNQGLWLGVMGMGRGENSMKRSWSWLLVGLGLGLWADARADQPWIEFAGGTGAGAGKKVVLVSGDEEYRSEEALPQLAKILSTRHGFSTVVLFAIDRQTGEINPNQNDNIPGLEQLAGADLLVLFTRFRNLPDDQMKWVDEYVQQGKPIVALRTSTHAFQLSPTSQYAKYSWQSKTWDGGFGRQVLGETWINHHGLHGVQSTRGILAEGAKDHPILRGIADGDIWGPTDVYGVRLPLPGDSQPLVMGQVLKGMKPTDAPATSKQNSPMMPVAWVKSYEVQPGKKGRIFTTTMGAATDLESEGVRRLLVNACYWASGMEEQIPARSDVALVGEFKPTPFKFDGFIKGKKPADYAGR